MNNFILRNENAVFYECGYSCDNEIFLNLDSRAFFLTDARYYFEALEALHGAEIICVSGSLIDFARKILRSERVKELIFDPFDFSYMDFCEISKNLHVNFKPRPNFSKKKRMVKSEKELEILRSAARFGALKFDEFAKFLKECGAGKSEKELFFEAEILLKNKGEFGLSFEPITALNKNAAKAHALPSDDTLKNADLILVDAGIKFKRYCSDRTRTAIFDENINFKKSQNFKNQKQQEIFEIVKEAQNLAIKAVKPGIKACQIDKIARDFITENGFKEAFFHSTGHGVGLDIHELPNISPKDDTILQKGMVFSIEPGIYLQNEFGVRIEDVVAVSDDGCEILSENV